LAGAFAAVSTERAQTQDVEIAGPDIGSAGQGSNVVIRTYVAEHGGTVFVSTLSQRQKRTRSRIMAVAVIVVMGASAGTVQAFHDHQRADAMQMWTP